jgi:hypothetical protein
MGTWTFPLSLSLPARHTETLAGSLLPLTAREPMYDIKPLTRVSWFLLPFIGACTSTAYNGDQESGGSGASGSGASGSGAQAGAQNSGGAGNGAGGGSGGAGANAGSPAGGTTSGGTSNGSGIVIGGPGCGLDSAAFCDSFDGVSDDRGRAGDLDKTYWSGSRMAPQGPTAGGQKFPIRAATLRPVRDGAQLPVCRADLPESVFPEQDAVVCDPSSDIGTNHLLVAVASQNYGQNSYRIRRPFDFAGRVGKIVFDAEPLAGGLLGWISIDVSEDPINALSFQSQQNEEGGSVPARGFNLQFNQSCNGQPDTVKMTQFHAYDEYVESTIIPDGETCTAIQWGKLNHFELQVSESTLELYASAFSADGTSFDTPTLVFSADVALPFSRGYVQITTHNHATLKYSPAGSGFQMGFTDLEAWIARWDNVGFDGPVISSVREYEIPDPLEPGTATEGEYSWDVVSTGYTVADEANGPSDKLHFTDVDLTGVTSARISLSAWYCGGCGSDAANFVLKYRLNGGSWHERPLSAAELANFTGGKSQGVVGEMLDVPVDELVSGDNTLEFVTVNVPQNYPPGVANIDLVLSTE